MCMVIGLAIGNVALLATDTRRNAYFTAGPPERRDDGGKLAALERLAVAGTGDALLADAVSAALRAEAPGLLGVARHRVAEIFATEAPLISAALPGAEPERTRFLAIGPGPAGPALETWDARGTLVATDAQGYRISWPPELSADESGPNPIAGEIQKRFAADVESCRSIASLVRAIASVFSAASALADSMSPETDFALFADGRIVAASYGNSSAALASASDQAINRILGAAA